MSRFFRKNIILKVFESENLLLMFFNVFIFIVIEIVFFWYILSETLVYIVLDKCQLIVFMLQQDPTLKKNMMAYLNGNDATQLPQRALEEQSARNSNNFNLILQYLGPTIYTLFSILMSITIYKLIGYRLVNYILNDTRFRINGTKMSRSSYFLLIFVIFSFVTEILFYYIVIREWKFISDAQLILLLYTKYNGLKNVNG